jgi:hypothetical protein
MPTHDCRKDPARSTRGWRSSGGPRDPTKIASTAPKCKNGICIKRADRPDIKDKQDFWNNTDSTKGITLTQMTDVQTGTTTPVGALWSIHRRSNRR